MLADTAISAPEESLCPKCGASRRADVSSCDGCGLEVSRMIAFAALRDAAVPEPLHQAWTHASEHWDDAAAHDELLRLVVANNCYAWAAGRYRAHPADAVAHRQLERLKSAAVVTLLATAASRPEASSTPYSSARSVLVILIVLIFAGLFYATVIRERKVTPPSARPMPAGQVQPLQPGHPVSPSTIK